MAVSSCWTLAFFITYVTQAIVVDAQNGSPYQLRISCGATQDVTSDNVRWRKDFAYSGGSSGTLLASRHNDLFPDLTSLRYFRQSDGSNNCYNISVPVGHYFFRFYFAYGDQDNSNLEPQFDVSLEGTVTYELTAGWSKISVLGSLDVRYSDSLVYVGDGAATACFHSSGHGNPSVSTFEILQVKDDSYSWGTDDLILKNIKRVSCGSSNKAPKFNYSADPWGGNRYWSRDDSIRGENGIGTVGTVTAIENTNLGPYYFPEGLYQSARISTAGVPLSYTYPVVSGQNYSIWLHLAEISPDITSEGQRTFKVSVNGQNLFPDLDVVDIVALAGNPYSAYFLNNSVLISGNTLTLTFTPIRGRVLVNGFEIYQVVPTEYVTRAEEVWALQSLKKNLKVPARLGWNGDPCAPAEHTWEGINCEAKPDYQVLSMLSLDNRGLKGFLSDDIEQLTSLQSLNLSHNMITGKIPPGLGNLSNLTAVDLSYNLLSGPIPVTLGKLPVLQTLDLNGNQLSGEVPEALGANAIQGASFNFSDNPGLCGPGFSSCSTGMSKAAKAGVFVATVLGALTLGCFIFCCWKRRQNIARSNRLMLSYDAPYAKSRTSRSVLPDIQLSRTSPEEFQFHSMYSNPPPR